SGALTQFNFTTTTTPGDSFTLVDGQTWNSGSLSAGTYTITESAQPGWDLANILVQGASNYTINLATATLTLHLNSEDVLVTFLNSEQLSPQLGSITVLKAACPTDTQTTFSYVTSAPEGVFSLINGGIWNSGPLAPGNYTVTELAQPGWDLTNIIIVNDSGSGSRVDLASGTVFVDLGLGESVTVLYQNTQQAPDLGSFSVTKVACPVGSSESFRFVTSASGGEL
ncbi:MAG: hypothetical protein FWD10_06180, partial [Candidatus Bathyarchaeota archaeon]|nr:hypothetical protein [Candidatus Termitimicrobium sp.]MCL2432131.1 hypothetical protein [Candidatus Termitimicrobium sp.]